MSLGDNQGCREDQIRRARVKRGESTTENREESESKCQRLTKSKVRWPEIVTNKVVWS